MPGRLVISEGDVGLSHRDGSLKATSPPRGRGGVIEIAGPDGAGKSAVCDGLLEGALAGLPVLHVHHRPGVLPSRGGRAGPVTEPHRDPPYPLPLRLAKICFLFVDFLLGWTFRFRPLVRRGGWVVIERGWWDIVVDPVRYRLQGSPRLLGALGRALPRSQLMVVLTAPAEQIFARKPELPLDEIERQLQRWSTLPLGGVRRVDVDASRPLEDVIGQVGAALARVQQATTASRERVGWVGLPTRRTPRWTLPRGPRAAAAGSLAIYQPVTVAGLLGWKTAWVLARLGAFRLLPRAEAPGARLREALAQHQGPGDALAVGYSGAPGRCVALVVDDRGRCRVLAKVTTAERGRRKLEREDAALASLGPTVPLPLSVPRVVGRGDGLLVFEAVRWRVRLRPWAMSEQVAEALGSFFRTGAAERDGRLVGFGHGDFAPWNLLRTGEGWVLLDWEDADECAPPFFDLFHYLVQAHALLGRPSRRAVLAGCEGRGWVGRAIRAYARGAGLAATDAPGQLVAYLEASQQRLRAKTGDVERGLAARRRLLQELQGRRSRRPPHTGPRVSGGLARRAGWGVADQALSSLTNFAVGIVVARTLGVASFGAFALAFATYTVALNVSRALATEPLLVRYSVAATAGWRRAVGRASGTAAMVGVVCALVCMLAGWLLRGPTGSALLALGVTLPGLLLQDGWRFVFFSRRRGLSAFLNDLLWAVALVPALGVLLVTHHTSVSLLVVGWGGAANAAALAGAFQAGVAPRPAASWAWLREHRDLAPRFLTEFLTLSGAIQLYFWAIGAITGLAAVGSLRAAQMLLGPLNVLFMGIGMTAVPEAIRILGRSVKALVALGAVLSGALAAASLLWGTGLLLMPARLGLRLLGPSWQPARAVLLPMVLMTAGIAATLGAQVGLRALAAARRSLWARMTVSVLSVAAAVLGSVAGGAWAAAWGLALVSLAGVPVWWWHLARGLAEGRHPGRPGPPEQDRPSSGSLVNPSD